VNIEGFDAYEVEPVTLPDVFARRPVVLFGKWRGPRAGTITLSGRTGAAPYQATILPAAAAPLTDSSALSHLWARHRIADLEDELALRPADETLKAAITRLGLEHRLLTRFTSFVAVDTEIRRATRELETVRQPLPLPQGVTNQAVGGGTPIVPEPSTYGLIATASALLFATFRRRFRR
jgi:Ca-activated chloride channel homolog